MKKKNEVSAELLNEYLRIRMEQYAEKKIKGMKADTETEFYSNIMEVVSLMDYCYVEMTIDNVTKLQVIRSHRNYNGTRGY